MGTCRKTKLCTALAVLNFSILVLFVLSGPLYILKCLPVDRRKLQGKSSFRHPKNERMLDFIPRLIIPIVISAENCVAMQRVFDSIANSDVPVGTPIIVSHSNSQSDVINCTNSTARTLNVTQIFSPRCSESRHMRTKHHWWWTVRMVWEMGYDAAFFSMENNEMPPSLYKGIQKGVGLCISPECFGAVVQGMLKVEEFWGEETLYSALVVLHRSSWKAFWKVKQDFCMHKDNRSANHAMQHGKVPDWVIVLRRGQVHKESLKLFHEDKLGAGQGNDGCALLNDHCQCAGNCTIGSSRVSSVLLRHPSFSTRSVEQILGEGIILNMTSVGHGTYQIVTFKDNVKGFLKLNLCRWCAGIEEALAYKLDRLFRFNRAPPVTCRVFSRNQVQDMAPLFQKEPYTQYLEKHTFLEGTIQSYIDSTTYHSVPGRFCYSPTFCSNHAKCPFSVSAVAEVAVYDYLLGNNDRLGNCFLLKNSTHPLRLDQGASHLWDVTWHYPSAPLQYPTVKKVYVRDLIQDGVVDKYICSTQNTQFGKRIAQLSKESNIGIMLVNMLLNSSAFRVPETQAYSWSRNKVAVHRLNATLTGRVIDLVQYWNEHCGRTVVRIQK